jgi:hypothetical protein
MLCALGFGYCARYSQCVCAERRHIADSMRMYIRMSGEAAYSGFEDMDDDRKIDRERFGELRA